MKRLEKNQKKSKGKNSVNDENYELMLLVSAKKMGLSFEELNLFSLNDFFDFTDLWIGEEEGSRVATQEDIDKYMG